jgi:hypothetical protein
MSQLDVADNSVTAETVRASVYVPPLQRTEGQPPPIAARGGLPYTYFDRDGDAEPPRRSRTRSRRSPRARASASST